MSETQYSFVAAIVNRGFGGDVMEVVRAAGTKEGTIIRSRRIGNEDVNSAGRKISPARKINFRKAEQKSASFTLPRAVVSSTSGYCTASGMIIKGNRLINA